MQIDDSMNRFLKENDIKTDRQEPNIVLSAKNVVHNGKNMALISEVCEFILLLAPTHASL
jgi:hypothetical protein